MKKKTKLQKKISKRLRLLYDLKRNITSTPMRKLKLLFGVKE